MNSASHPSASILTINGGSSSIRFAIFEMDADQPLVAGKIDRIGLNGTTLEILKSDGAPGKSEPVVAGDHRTAVNSLLDTLESMSEFSTIRAVGHRVVHGMTHTEPEQVTPKLIQELKRITPFDPDHLPREIELIEAFSTRHPQLPQVACFDTSFHRSMPRVAKILPIPRRLDEKGVQRYGFHGLSYSFLIDELKRIGDPAATRGRVILAHLGNGASLAAVRDGKSIDTSMGFTPASGLVMSSRSGDLDPGLVSYLANTEGMSPGGFQKMVNQDSGLRGISDLSSDIRDLLDAESRDIRAAEALSVFCYQVKKWIGAYAAALGGLDTLVFAGGIGEHSPVIRQRICDGLQFLGIEIHEKANAKSASLISVKCALVAVRVIPTNEEISIVRSVRQCLGMKCLGMQ